MASIFAHLICALFSRLRELNKHMYLDTCEWMRQFDDRMQQPNRYVEIYNDQREQGKYFVHEHPWLATSWDVDCITKLLTNDAGRRVQTHMCQFGMVARTGKVGSEDGPVLKPAWFLTNSAHIAKELHRLCPRDHQHIHLVGGRAAGSAICPPGLCRAICRGMAAQKRENDIGKLQTPALTKRGLFSISRACMQATAGYPPEVVNDKGDFSLNGMQMEVDDRGGLTGNFRYIYIHIYI